MLVSQGSDKSCKDKRGYTPLHAAAAGGHVDVAKYLLRNGAEVSTPVLTLEKIHTPLLLFILAYKALLFDDDN